MKILTKFAEYDIIIAETEAVYMMMKLTKISQDHRLFCFQHHCRKECAEKNKRLICVGSGVLSERKSNENICI